MVSASDAQRFAKEPGVLLVGKIRSPFVRSGTHGHPATLDDPSDLGPSLEGVVIDLDEIWYFDVASGRVFYRQRVAG